MSSHIDDIIGVVAVADVAAFNAFAATQDPAGGSTLGDKLGLSASGNAPASHRWFCWRVTAAQKTAMEADAAANGWKIYKSSDGDTAASVLAAEGLAVIEE